MNQVGDSKHNFSLKWRAFDSGSEQIMFIGATNRPQELDEAARKRLTKRLYIPLPSSEARAWIVRNLSEKDGLFKLSKKDIDKECKLTKGYSRSDMKNLLKEASMGPLREACRQSTCITRLKKEDIMPVTLQVNSMKSFGYPNFLTAFSISPNVSVDFALPFHTFCHVT